MCGRFVAKTEIMEVAEYFRVGRVTPLAASLSPSYNVAPSQLVPVVYEDVSTGRVLDAFRWGLVPFWARGARSGARLINARAETLREKSAFKRPFVQSRCIVPADGFYEWKASSAGGKKRPFYFSRRDSGLLAFPGIFRLWHPPSSSLEGEEAGENAREMVSAEAEASVAIITSAARGTVASVHDRMPAVLGEDLWELWLDRDCQDTEVLSEFLVSGAEDPFVCHEVDPAVGNVRNNHAGLLEFRGSSQLFDGL